MTRVLIAEDEERIALFIQKGLKAAGFTSSVVSDGVSALDLASSGEFDLLILDVGLPRMDGFTVLSTLRAMNAKLPVIIVTARDSLPDTVAGLEGGADDYMAKPFRFEELLARIRLRLREQNGSQAADTLNCGGLSLDIGTRCATVGGRTVELSAREFSMARTFMENPGQVLTRDQLLSRVWGYDFDGASNVVDVYVRYLRNKLGADRLVTVRGVGYRLAELP